MATLCAPATLRMFSATSSKPFATTMGACAFFGSYFSATA